MNKNIDKIPINETIRGYFIFSEGDKIICKGHNLIVNDGRKFLFDTFMNKVFGVDEKTPGNYASYKFYKLYAGRNSNTTRITLPETTFDEVQQCIIKDDNNVEDATYALEIPPSFNNTESSTNKSRIGIEKSDSSRELVFDITIEGKTNPECIGEFILTFADPNKSSIKLFSRFLIDPTYIVSGTTYSLKYYIEF